MLKKISLATLVILVAVLTSCTLPYSASSKPKVTPSPTERGFTEALPKGNNPMAIVEDIATGTAAAMTAAAGGGTAGTPVEGTPLTPSTDITVTPTPIIAGAITTTPSLTPIVVGGNTVTPGPTLAAPTAIVNRPGTYTLQVNEFVYCIARRFNVDPDDILALNGLVDSEPVYAGTVLTMPTSGSFPGARALRSHPATYVVTGNADTNVYGVACKFGDVDPARIVQANPGLTLASVLTIGQSISVP